MEEGNSDDLYGHGTSLGPLKAIVDKKRIQLICNASICDPIHTDVGNRFVLYLGFNHLDGLELSVGR